MLQWMWKVNSISEHLVDLCEYLFVDKVTWNTSVFRKALPSIFQQDGRRL